MLFWSPGADNDGYNTGVVVPKDPSLCLDIARESPPSLQQTRRLKEKNNTMAKNVFTMSLFSVFIFFAMLIAVVIGRVADQPKVRLVNVIFRHGDRAPDPAEGYPKDPYKNVSYFPMGRGGLTNNGKQREYELGQALKTRYGDFLGPIYVPASIEARSTYYDRTKMSLQLVLSGLFPPTPMQQWNKDLLWQPIPTIYKRSHEDILLLSDECPKYLAEYERVLNSSEVVQKYETFANLTKYLERHTGRTINSAFDFYDIYHTLTAQIASGLPKPAWAEEIYPYGQLWDGTVFVYDIYAWNNKLKRLNGGLLVRKMSEDATALRSGTLPAGRKMYAYSCHETNIAAVLKTLGVWEPHVPQYSSAVIVEVLELRGEYFVKVFHYLGIPAVIVAKTIPGCDELCPLDEFLELMKPVIPSDADLICVKKNTPSTQNSLS